MNLLDLQRMRWQLLKDDVPWNPNSGFYEYWKAHPEIGSPVSAEVTLDDGENAQAFANCVLVWNGEQVMRE